MKTSTERILTTHTGSLPRPPDLDQMLFDREEGAGVDDKALNDRVRDVVAETVAAQVSHGVDVVNDGEVGKIGYSTYVKDRLTGFGGESSPLVSKEMIEFPGAIKDVAESAAFQHMKLPACDGPISLRDAEAVPATSRTSRRQVRIASRMSCS